jgi:hypothetical protein
MKDYPRHVHHMTNSKQHRSTPTKSNGIKSEIDMPVLKSNRKQTFFVIIKLVPIATEPETASIRPIYLSSMVF